MPQPHPSVTITFEYGSDVAGAAEALLAILSSPSDAVECLDDDQRAADDEADA